jgi:hypothetical protein
MKSFTCSMADDRYKNFGMRIDHLLVTTSLQLLPFDLAENFERLVKAEGRTRASSSGKCSPSMSGLSGTLLPDRT